MKKRYSYQVVILAWWFSSAFEIFFSQLFVLFAYQDRKIEELKQSLLRYKKVQDMVMSVQGKKGETSLYSNNIVSKINYTCTAERRGGLFT